MEFHSSEDIDNESCISLLLQIIEYRGELNPTFYMFTPEDKEMNLEYLVALSQGLTHARMKVDSIIEIVQNG